MSTADEQRTSVTSMDREEWVEALKSLGQPAFRADQLLQWIYQKRVMEFGEMTNLSERLRAELEQRYVPRELSLVRRQGSADTTQKFLYRLADGRFIECVLIPASPALYGSRSDRHTLCVSSQVGCAYDCKFCASGLAGFTRNLTSGEIVEQVLQTEAEAAVRVNNLVFMGMGEPLANLRNLLKAVRIINAPWGVGIGARHMTVSTSGLAPQIRKLAEQPLQIRLAVSLHGATDEVRERIMPVNRQYPLSRLFESLADYRQRKKQRITFEYILIAGVNDDLSQAERLAEHCRRLEAKVNLIPYNTVEGLSWERPSEARQDAFLAVLKRAKIPATLRREKGHDIDAACGQLRLKEEERAGNLGG